jgi:Uncharacterized protein conserved in bacteria (DUF2188)
MTPRTDPIPEADDEEIDRIRATRHRISERFGHDPYRLAAHYMERRKEREDRLRHPSRPKTIAKLEPAGAEKKELYVERRPQGGFAVRRPGSERASTVKPTQREAIDSARKLVPGAAIHVARVRHTSKGKPDQWRKP